MDNPAAMKIAIFSENSILSKLEHTTDFVVQKPFKKIILSLNCCYFLTKRLYKVKPECFYENWVKKCIAFVE